jgi:hypothetical protein
MRRLAAGRSGEHQGMAKTKQKQDLFDHLRANGVRKKVAKAIAGGASSKNGKKAEALAQTALADLRSASDAIKDRVVNRDSKRSEAAKKAARTRKRNAAKRSAAAKKAAATRKSAKTRARASR